MTDGTPAPRQQAPSRNEFIALMAMMLATVAFSIDAMLPSLPEIGEALSPDNINRVQLVITSFVLGMGMGTFLTGPLSDALGRKPVIIGGGRRGVVSTFAPLPCSFSSLLATRA